MKRGAPLGDESVPQLTDIKKKKQKKKDHEFCGAVDLHSYMSL